MSESIDKIREQAVSIDIWLVDSSEGNGTSRPRDSHVPSVYMQDVGRESVTLPDYFARTTRSKSSKWNTTTMFSHLLSRLHQPSDSNGVKLETPEILETQDMTSTTDEIRRADWQMRGVGSLIWVELQSTGHWQIQNASHQSIWRCYAIQTWAFSLCRLWCCQ